MKLLGSWKHKMEKQMLDSLVAELADNGTYEVPGMGEISYDDESQHVEIYPSKEFVHRVHLASMRAKEA